MDIGRVFIFSNSLRKMFHFLKTSTVKCYRWLRMLFKKNKKIEIITFEYFKNWHFNNAYLVIVFNLKNVLWFRIQKNQGLILNNSIVINLENLKSNTIDFEIFGFRNKRIITIDISKEIELISNSFKTNIQNIRGVEFGKNEIGFKTPNINVVQTKPSIKIQALKVKNNKIEIKHNQFEDIKI